MDKLTLQMVEVINSALTQQIGQLAKYPQQLIKLNWILLNYRYVQNYENHGIKKETILTLMHGFILRFFILFGFVS